MTRPFVQVYRCTEELIWESLWDDARKVSKGAMEDLDDIYGGKEVRNVTDNKDGQLEWREREQQQEHESKANLLVPVLQADPQMLKILRDNYTRPIRPRDGQQLLYNQWGELLFHLNKSGFAIKRFYLFRSFFVNANVGFFFGNYFFLSNQFAISLNTLMHEY